MLTDYFRQVLELPEDVRDTYLSYWELHPFVNRRSHEATITLWNQLEIEGWPQEYEDYLGYRVYKGKPMVLSRKKGNYRSIWEPLGKLIVEDQERVIHYLMITGAIFQDPAWHVITTAPFREILLDHTKTFYLRKPGQAKTTQGRYKEVKGSNIVITFRKHLQVKPYLPRYC